MHRSALTHIVIDCDDLDAGAAFWSGALGAKVASWDGPYVFLEAKPGGLHLGLQRVPEAKTAKSRVHLDISADDRDAEVARLEALGARRREQVESWWVMEDPNGNEFCVLSADAGDLPQGAAAWEP